MHIYYACSKFTKSESIDKCKKRYGYKGYKSREINIIDR